MEILSYILSPFLLPFYSNPYPNSFSPTNPKVGCIPQTMYIADMAIEVGEAREGQSFVLKI
jgi:hypothetical protein